VLLALDEPGTDINSDLGKVVNVCVFLLRLLMENPSANMNTTPKNFASMNSL
jgi:hypothetical protein